MKIDSVSIRISPIHSDRLWMNAKAECTDSFVVKIRMTPSDYDWFVFSPNWCLKFIPNDSAPIRTKLAFRLNPFNSVKSFWMIPRHSPFSPNDSVAHSNGLDSEWFGYRFRIHTESHRIIFVPNESDTCIRVAHWCGKRQFSLPVNGVQTRVLYACVKKIIFLPALHNDSVYHDFLSESFLRSYTVANLHRNTFSRARTRNTTSSGVLPTTW